MTNTPEPKGKGISSHFSGILHCSTQSTTDLTNIHAHNISSVYPSERKVIKKSKKNGSNNSISIYGSNHSDQKPRKTKNIQNTILPGSTQEAVADAIQNIESISEFSPTPSPTCASHVASPKVPLVPPTPGKPSAIMVISSSQESKQIRDAKAGFKGPMEYTLNNKSQAGTPKSVAMDLTEDTCPTSATPKTNHTSHICRLTPLHDLTWSPQDQYWLERLKDRAYPLEEALECTIKYTQITTKVIQSIIKFMQSIAKINKSILL